MSQHTSSHDGLDEINQQVATREPSRFGSYINSLNSFLSTATDTIITVDGVINRRETSQYQPQVEQAPLYPGMSVSKGGLSPIIKYSAITALALGGGLVIMKAMK